MTAKEFRGRAIQLGAAVTEYGDFNRSGEVWVKTSAPRGGCPSGCSCTPGLWVSMSDGAHIAIAHFGSDWERGGKGRFTEEDFGHWRTLSQEVAL